MDLEQLRQFIVKARKNSGYEVVGEGLEIVLEDGTRQIGPYIEGNLSYIDRYKGFDPFEGEVEIREKESIIWKVKYKGEILDPEHKGKMNASKLYATLKNALCEFPEDRPFKRGPDNITIGDYEYSNQCSFNTVSFRNIEQIIYIPTGKRIYLYKDSGGLEDEEKERVLSKERSEDRFYHRKRNFPNDFN